MTFNRSSHKSRGKGQTSSLGAVSQADGSVQWRVWAPRSDQVDLVLIDGESRETHAMSREDRGYYSFSKTDVAEGQRYAFRLDGGPERPDPASKWQPDGVNHASAVLCTERFKWSDDGWSGIARQELVFYELHVGTFTPEGTFDSIIPRLPALRELGVTALELMPVGQFSGRRDWGYDGVHPFAPQNSYGGPQGLQRLVDACHSHGLAVFMDVVYNHIGPEGGYLGEYGHYFTDHYRTPWGAAVNFDDRGSDAVREFFLANVRMWIKEYRVDGLRLDAVHAIFDFGARHILQEVKDVADRAARELGRQVHIIAESDLNDVRLLLPSQCGGYGLDLQWNDDFHHTVHASLTGERQGYYQDYGHLDQLKALMEKTFVLDGCYSAHRDRCHGGSDAGLPGDRFVVCIQNHDQVGNRARGERLGSLITPPARRLAASLLLLSPYLPLLFMGEEYGEEHPFQFFCSFRDPELIENVRKGRRREFEAFHSDHIEVPDPQSHATFEASRLTWDWADDPEKAGLRRLYQDLLLARRSWLALGDFADRAAHVFPDPECGPVLELIRGGKRFDQEKAIRALFNFCPEAQPVAKQKGASLLWTSESERYNGKRERTGSVEQLLPYECLVFKNDF